MICGEKNAQIYVYFYRIHIPRKRGCEANRGGETKTYSWVQGPLEVVAVQVGYAWLNRPEVSATATARTHQSVNDKRKKDYEESRAELT